MPRSNYDKNVFFNCPFDSDYEPILQAIIFSVLYLGFNPRIAIESSDSSQTRIDKIVDLICQSKYSIHDLSRCQAKEIGEHFRLNMPFELGIDYGCKRLMGKKFSNKKLLILEEQKYRYQAAISDLSGCDIKSHSADYQIAMEATRDWLVSEAGADRTISPTEIKGAYEDFHEWHYEKKLSEGFSDNDIKSYPTVELLEEMKEWISRGKPI